jgi:ubiquinone/menaquinone biosynthesis C-methylase UbiE
MGSGHKIACCDVKENIPFADETFDVVTMFDTLGHIKNYESTF